MAHEVFGDAHRPAGKGFFDWLSSSGGQLVVRSRLRSEMGQGTRFHYCTVNTVDIDEIFSILSFEEIYN